MSTETSASRRLGDHRDAGAGLPLIVKATVAMSTSPSFGARAETACELFVPRSFKAARFLNVRISDVSLLLAGEF
jgi:hypothetical protein